MDECCKNAPAAAYPAPRKDQATPQLSCELCRERKVKCNKLDPCRNCAASGVVCVPIYRLRLPRGRHAHRSRRTSEPQPQPASRDADDAATGMPREQVVEGSETQPTASAPANPTMPGPAIPKGTKKQGLSIQRPDHFWADLVEEIHELRGVIELAPGERDETGAQASDPAPADPADGGIGALGLWGLRNPPAVPRHFAPSQVALSHNKVAAGQLCQVYLRNVDPVIKILHGPSLRKWMLQGERYLGYPEGHASVEALSSAVCYSAASSMTENQCQAMFYTSKSSIAVDCRRACEVAIERSGILATRDITVLQAFVLYLIGRRSEDRSRAVWTLVALAVRIAKALGLHLDRDPEAGQSETFFAQQMRKRLWLTICLMDLQASFAQASEPLVGHGEAGSSLTLVRHVNDADFDPTTLHPVPSREGLTDMTFALVTYHVQLAGRLLNFASDEEKSDGGGGGGDGSGSGGERTVTSVSSNSTSDWEARQQHVRRFEQEALGLLHFCDPESSPSAWFTWHGTQCLVAAVRLSALRPLQRARPGCQAAVPSRTEGDTELLRHTLHVLEKAQLMHTDPRGEGFRWYVTIPWLALATAIAECYVCADAALVRRAWPVVEASYRHHEAVITRHSGEMLQGPLAKLMRQTREKLAALLLNGGGGQGFGVAGGSAHRLLPTPQPTPHLAPSRENLVDSSWAATISSTTADMTFGLAGAAYASASSSLSSVAQLLPPQMPSPTPTPLHPMDSQPALADAIPPLPSPDLSDPSWRSWDEIMSSSSFDDFANPGLFFSENILGGY